MAQTFNVPDMHDGFLDGAYVSDKREVRLFLRSVGGRRVTLVLEGVEAGSVSNMKVGNIIFDIERIAASDLELERIRRAYPEIENGEAFAKLLMRARDAGLSAFHLNPSYGAECSFLFKVGRIVDGHVFP